MYAKLMCILFGKIPISVVSNEDREEADYEMELAYIKSAREISAGDELA